MEILIFGSFLGLYILSGFIWVLLDIVIIGTSIGAIDKTIISVLAWPIAIAVRCWGYIQSRFIDNM